MSEVRWQIQEADEARVAELSRTLSLPVSVARALWLRGQAEPELARRFLARSLRDLTHPLALSGMREACDRIVRARENGEGVLIHGDFDADGVTSSAILTLFLRDLGLRAEAFIPNRLIEGHGVSLRALERAKAADFKLMITCDCGSSNAKEIALFAAAGVDTIVTDHHFVGDSKETGAILVNPRGDEDSGHEGLAGVGVAFMLMTALRTVLRDRGAFAARAEPNLRDYLDIVALGTVADMAPLSGQNRILVAEGLKQLSRSTRPAIVAMKDEAGLAAKSIGTEEIGFRLAPKINAACRLGHGEEALALLTTADLSEARRLARQLEAWNTERKALQERMVQIAFSQAMEQAERGAPCIVVSSSDFHSGVIGLVAQKLAETFFRPVFLFAVEGDVARASARSRRGVDLHRVLEACADLLIQFGGHAEAGGCVAKTADLPELRRRLVEAAGAQMGAGVKTLLIDASLRLDEVDETYFAALTQLSPFGMGNPTPVFTSVAKVAGPMRQVGQGHAKATLMASDGRPFDAIGFGLWEKASSLGKDVEVAFSLEENIWQGRRSIQLNLKDIRGV